MENRGMKKIKTKQKKKERVLIERIGISSRLLFFILSFALITALISFYIFTVGLKGVIHSPEKFVLADIIEELHQETPHPTIPTHTSQIIFHGDRFFPKIALTFDADMTAGMEKALASRKVASYFDKKLIQVLESTHTKATLFLTGMWIETYPKEAKQLAQNPLFELSNHSYDHRGFDGMCYGLHPVSDDEEIEEVVKTQRLLQQLGVTNYYFRFPGGCYSQQDLNILTSVGVTAIQWDVAGVDGFNDNQESIEQNVISHVENGSIIVLHMNGAPNEPRTADAVAHIIPQLRKRGFQFVKLSELLH